MRHFKLSAAFAVVLMGGSVTFAGVVGTLSIASQFAIADATPTITRATTSQVFVDGRVPVRVRTVVGGTLVPATRAAVTFAHNGQAVFRTDEIDGGIAQADGLSDGGYSVMVDGADGFAAFATWVDSASAADESGDAVISVGLVPASDMPTVSRLIRSRHEVSDSSSPIDNVGELVSAPVSPLESRSTRSLSHGSELALGADGTLHGRVVLNDQSNGDSVPVQASHVYFVRSNEVVGEALSDADGLFVVSGLASGVYSLVVTSVDSFVAMSVRVAPHAATVARKHTIEAVSLTSYAEDVPVTEVAMVYQQDVPVFEEPIYDPNNDDLTGGAPMYGSSTGGGGGGAAGGGGFAGGGPGLGALLLGAGLGAGIYAIADDDDGGNRRITPATP